MFLLFSILIIILAPSLSSDIVSLNSGGSENIVIIPSEELEGFFFATGIFCGNGIIEAGEECDDGSSNGVACSPAAGSSCSYCSDSCETVVVQGEALPDGNGGGPSAAVTVLGLVVSPKEINLNLIANADPTDFSTSVTKVITVTNYRTSVTTVVVSQVGLEGMVYINETSFNLSSGESKDINVIFVALSQTGVFVGKILFGTEAVLVSLNVRPKLLLFDSNIVVLNKDYQVAKGNLLRTEVTLTPMGNQERLDVTLDYVIKDFNGQVYLEKSETLLLEEKITLERDFDLGDIPLGKYIIGLELVYPEGKAPSSAHFEVISKSSRTFGVILLILIILILIILIILIIILIKRRRDKDKEQAQTLSTT